MNVEAGQAEANSVIRTFFDEWLPSHVENLETLPVTGVFVFDVQGPGGGRWTLDLWDGRRACRPGTSEQAHSVITLADVDLAAVLQRETDLEELFYRQRVQVDGDLNLAAGLLPLFNEATAPDIGLATLLAPYATGEFLTRYWPAEPLLLPPSLARLDAIESMLPVDDVDTLLDSWRGTVRVFPPGQRDQLSPQVTTDAAAQLYARGFTLVFDSVDLWYADLHAWLEAMQVDLGLPPNVWGRCMIYVTPAGSGLNAHFDENANFAIQLRGAKRWWLAPNQSVMDPTVSYRLGGHLHPELSTETHAPLPEQMPDEGAFELTLEPGSVLFLPRSYWHRTKALEPSLSLNFTFDQPCWADVLTRAIRARLVRRPEWRELATGVGGDDERAGPAVARAATLLSDLTADCTAVSAEELLADVSPLAPREQLLDLKRDWVETLTQLATPAQSAEGRSSEGPAVQAASAAGDGVREATAGAGMLLYERLLLGWENPGAIEGTCQFELDGPGNGPFYLRISPREMTYHEGRVDGATAVVRMSSALAHDLAVGENVDFHDPENFDHIDAEGDVAMLGMLAQMTKVPNRDAGERFADSETRAAALPRMTEPKRLSAPTPDEVAEAVEAGIPLVVRDALAGWQPAMEWTFESIRRQFGHVKVKSTLGVGTIDEFMTALDSVGDEHPPYTMGAVMDPELAAYLPPPFFDPASFGPAQIWMGSGPNQISTLLHRDSGDAFLGQLIGRKHLKLYSPDQTPYMYVYKSYNRDQPCWVNPWDPDLERFPLFREAFATEFILEPGELLVIPRGWYHTVLALDRTLSVGFHREPVTDFGRMLGKTPA